MTRWFTGLRGKAKEYPILAFDIEGVGGQDGCVCGAAVSDATAYFSTDRADFFEAIKGFAADGYMVFSLNLEYDLPVLAGEALLEGDLLFTPGGLLWGSYWHGLRRVKLYDSRYIFPRLSLATIGDLVGLPKLDLPEDLLTRLSQGEGWERYNPEERLQIERYCRRDAEVLHRALVSLQEVVLTLGGQLRASIAGCAMDIYRRHFHLWPWKTVGQETNRIVRPAYYGGRNENYVYGKIEGVNMYDITSLYPAVMAEGVYPHPSHLKLEVAPPPAGEWWNWEGVAQATLDVPLQFIPPLPCRERQHLYFPCGEMSGLWTIAELRNALRNGVRFENVEWVLGSPVTFNPFSQFVEQLFGLRAIYLEEGDGRSNLVKLLLNALYGRFGLNPDHGLYQIFPIDNDADLARFQGYVTREYGGTLVAMGPVPNQQIPSYVNVLFAAQTTALGRIKLWQAMSEQDTDMVYCDTDSIITRGILQTQEGLGGWRTQMSNGCADLLGPKEYALHNDALESSYRVKGVPSGAAADYFKMGVARFRRALTIREALQKDALPSSWVETIYSRGQIRPKRYPASMQQYYSQGWTSTLPFDRQELDFVGAGDPVINRQALEAQSVLRPKLPSPWLFSAPEREP